MFTFFIICFARESKNISPNTYMSPEITQILMNANFMHPHQITKLNGNTVILLITNLTHQTNFVKWSLNSVKTP